MSYTPDDETLDAVTDESREQNHMPEPYRRLPEPRAMPFLAGRWLAPQLDYALAALHVSCCDAACAVKLRS